MKFEPSDKENLAKLGVKSLIDLALILPKNFDDLSIKPTPNEGENVVEIETTGMGYRPNLLSVTAFCLTWEIDIKITIFNAKGWHHGVFAKGKKMLIHGKSTIYNGMYQFTNPTVITNAGGITPKFRQSMRDSTISKLIEKYITAENLREAGLNDDEIDYILAIHKNDANSIKMLENIQNGDTDVLKMLEIYNYLQKLSHKKTEHKAKKFTPNDISTWLRTLPFTPTDDQIKAIDEIKSDFISPVSKRRVVMGDVGSGKTLVILASALMAQSAVLMAPTTILAEQIYSEALRLLPADFRVMLVKSGEKNIDFSGADFIIGTHALLYHDLPSVNVLMVDEQHRFGSTQRQKIEYLVANNDERAHYIQFSATPIPRTLSLIQSDFVNFSFLKTMPFEKKIHTRILQNSGFSALMSHLRDEIAKNHQAIIVYPLVNESEKNIYQSLNEGAPFWQKHFKNVFITHGKDKEKDEILSQFRQNGDILVTTTIVEVGISLPRLSIIVIVGAERLGLATLHQLRGRVGRNGDEAWCYLYTKMDAVPPRLKEFADTLDGFKVAEMDLKTRQAGDLLDGTIQHGEIFSYYNYEADITELAKNRLKNTTIK